MASDIDSLVSIDLRSRLSDYLAGRGDRAVNREVENGDRLAALRGDIRRAGLSVANRRALLRGIFWRVVGYGACGLATLLAVVAIVCGSGVVPDFAFWALQIAGPF